ncbi:MAG TPA: hypothetical protein VMR21_00120, partial [Vicinamibacteria bacterium]|nr:hypothetical protein [Vicinamibacteria bacterium]
RYPELPVLSTEEAWAPARPAPAADEWARARALLERSLGDIAAGTESLKRRYDPFAATCLAAAISSSPLSPRPGVDWLASLKTAQRVRSGTLLAEDGSATDCEEAWRRLVTRADALFSDLQAAASLARARSVSPEHWRMLLADHHLVVWDGY